jgi:hypothetical protein
MLTDTALRNFKPKPKTYKASDRDGGAKVFFLSASWALQGLGECSKLVQNYF